MGLKGLAGLCIICLFLGCSIFKKDKTLAPDTKVSVVTTDTSLISETTINTDTTLTVVIDTIPVPIPPKKPLEYMTIEEKAMIDEINLLRADPNSYIQYVDAYIQDFMEDPNWDFTTKQAERNAGEELIRSLRIMPPLPLLNVSEELYKVAKKHGLDIKESGMISHRGSDDSQPEDRIRNSTTLLGQENLAAGGRSVRESLIMLLVDVNDRADRGHRKAILNPAWQFVACYYAGTVDDIPNTWVQLFAYKDPNDVPKELPIRSLPANKEREVGVDNPSDATVNKTSEEKTTAGQATGDFSFMTAEEKAMIDEINLMRTNPSGYIQYVEQYVVEMKKIMMGADPDFDAAANEIKTQLRSMSALSILKPHKKLYEITKAHGLDNKNHHQLEHKGTDGRQSFDRIKDSGLGNSINSQGVYAPNENLVGGESSVRNSVIALLIDAGISTRGHRKALIEPTWTHVACYKIGTIENLKDLQGMEDDDMKNCWVQFFAKG